MADDKDELAGKYFDLAGAEREVVELRSARADELYAQAQQLYEQSRAERRRALQRALAHALERVGAKELRDVDWKLVDEMPVGFTIKPKPAHDHAE